MFKKKDCRKCGERVNSNYLFCPHCGNLTGKKKSSKNSGMLGEDDFTNEFENFQESILGGVGGRALGKILESTISSLMKNVEKEMKKENQMRNQKKIAEPKTNFQLFINGKRVENLNDNPLTKQKVKIEREDFQEINLPQNDLKGFSNLPKNEPKTNVRRFSDKVIYEINIPGVKSLKDISITKLENNIEIKARTKDKAYNKLIPVNFPIVDYNFSRGKLFLELDSKE
jgi:HSP20 family molecular chaperone IbpA|tara:strand:+ start:346 stop:1029 length:684 start_codon:yes stop_codon:yes gene_type:complete